MQTTAGGISRCTDNREVIQRYCPKIGENVLMVRSLGFEGRPICLCRDSCKAQKEGKCNSRID